MLKIDMFGEMREFESIAEDLGKLDELVIRYKAAGKTNALLKATLRAYLCNIFVLFIGGALAVLLNFASPFLVLKLINFIEEEVAGEGNLNWQAMKPGVILSALLVGT